MKCEDTRWSWSGRWNNKYSMCHGCSRSQKKIATSVHVNYLQVGEIQYMLISWHQCNYHGGVKIIRKWMSEVSEWVNECVAENRKIKRKSSLRPPSFVRSVTFSARGWRRMQMEWKYFWKKNGAGYWTLVRICWQHDSVFTFAPTPTCNENILYFILLCKLFHLLSLPLPLPLTSSIPLRLSLWVCAFFIHFFPSALSCCGVSFPFSL